MTASALALPSPAPFRPRSLKSYQFNPRFLLSGLPALVFWAATQVAPPALAVALSFVTFLAVFQATKGVGTARLLALVSLAAVSIGAGVGMAASSERAYLAADPASDLLIAGLFLGSAMLGRPLVGAVVREAVPGLAAHLNPDHRIYLWLTVGWGLFNVATAIIRWQGVTHLSIGQYLFWSRVLAWPIGYSLMLAMCLLLLHQARFRPTENAGRAA